MSSISNARIFDEFCKIFLNGMAEKNFNKLSSFGLNKFLIANEPEKTDYSRKLVSEALRNTDKRFKTNKSVTPGFLIAALLWPELLDKCLSKGEINLKKIFRSAEPVLRKQQKITAIPRKFNSYIKDIWIYN